MINTLLFPIATAILFIGITWALYGLEWALNYVYIAEGTAFACLAPLGLMQINKQLNQCGFDKLVSLKNKKRCKGIKYYTKAFIDILTMVIFAFCYWPYGIAQGIITHKYMDKNSATFKIGALKARANHILSSSIVMFVVNVALYILVRNGFKPSWLLFYINTCMIATSLWLFDMLVNPIETRLRTLDSPRVVSIKFILFIAASTIGLSSLLAAYKIHILSSDVNIFSVITDVLSIRHSLDRAITWISSLSTGQTSQDYLDAIVSNLSGGPSTLIPFLYCILTYYAVISRVARLLLKKNSFTRTAEENSTAAHIYIDALDLQAAEKYLKHLPQNHLARYKSKLFELLLSGDFHSAFNITLKIILRGRELAGYDGDNTVPAREVFFVMSTNVCASLTNDTAVAYALWLIQDDRSKAQDFFYFTQMLNFNKHGSINIFFLFFLEAFYSSAHDTTEALNYKLSLVRRAFAVTNWPFCPPDMNYEDEIEAFALNIVCIELADQHLTTLCSNVFVRSTSHELDDVAFSQYSDFKKVLFFPSIESCLSAEPVDQIIIYNTACAIASLIEDSPFKQECIHIQQIFHEKLLPNLFLRLGFTQEDNSTLMDIVVNNNDELFSA